MGSTHPQPRGRLQNRALCVQQISSRRILLGAWVLSHPQALAGVLQPWIVEASLPAHSFLVTEVRWMVDRKVAPSYKTERALSCSEVSERKRAPLSITEIRFWNVYFASYPSCLFSFFFVNFSFFFPQFNSQAQNNVIWALGLWGSCPIWSTLNIENDILTEAVVQILTKWKLYMDHSYVGRKVTCIWREKGGCTGETYSSSLH